MKLKPLHKKAQLNTMGPAIIALVIAGVFLILGLVMLQELRDADIVSSGVNGQNDTAFRQANATLIGMSTFAEFWEIIVLAIVITIVIGLLLLVFGGRNTR